MPILSKEEIEGLKIPSQGSVDYWEDSKWAGEHFSEIVKKYPDQWVSIVGKKVIAFGRTIAEVEEITFQKTGRDEFPIYFAERGVRVYNY